MALSISPWYQKERRNQTVCGGKISQLILGDDAKGGKEYRGTVRTDASLRGSSNVIGGRDGGQADCGIRRLGGAVAGHEVNGS